MEKWFAGSMKERYKKFYMMFDKRFKNRILCSNTLCDSRAVYNRDPCKVLNVRKTNEFQRRSFENSVPYIVFFKYYAYGIYWFFTF